MAATITWGAPSDAIVLQASNNYQDDDPIIITSYGSDRLPSPTTIEFVVGSTTSPTAEAMDSISVAPTSSSHLITTYTVTLTKWLSAFNAAEHINVYARIRTSSGTYYSSIRDAYLSAPPVVMVSSLTSNFPDDNSVFIEGVTNLTARGTAVGQFGATINSMKLSYRNGSESGNVDMIPDGDEWVQTISSLSAGQYNITLMATDSRGTTGAKIRVVSVKAHTAPNISYEVFRCDANGDRDMNGGYISVTAWSIANPSELGISSITVQGVETGTTTEIIPQTALTEGVASIFGGTLSPDKSYTLTITATDDAGTYGATAQTATQEVVVPKVVRVINVKEGGTGLAFGQRSTKDSIVDSAWEIDAPIVRPASLTNFYPSVSAVSGSWSTLRCTGTVSEAPTVMTNADKTIIYIAGRMRLTSFSRSDANPGLTVQTSLRPSSRMSFDCGVRFTGNNAAPEKMQAILSTAGLLTITTTETLANITGSTFYALFFNALLPIL